MNQDKVPSPQTIRKLRDEKIPEPSKSPTLPRSPLTPKKSLEIIPE